MAITELSKADEAAFAAMQSATSGPAPTDDAAADEAPLGQMPSPAAPETEPTEPAEEPEAAAEAEGEEGEATPRKPRMVNYDALHEERTRRQQLETDNRRLHEERTRFDERLRIIQELNTPQPQQPQPIAEDDYVGKIDNQGQRLARMEEFARQQAQQQQEIGRNQAIASAMINDGNTFAAQNPDFHQAFDHWSRSRAEELKQLGFAEQDIPTQIRTDQWQIGQAALQRRQSPAATFYALAQQRGYRRGAAASNGNGEDNGAEAQIDRISRGQARNPTLSGSGGSAAPSAMTANMLLNMSNAEFDAWTSKHKGAADRLYGKEIPPNRRR
jgi:hypothetical protein